MYPDMPYRPDLLGASLVVVVLVLGAAYFIANRHMIDHVVTEIDGVTVVSEVATDRSDVWRYAFLDSSGRKFYQDICKDYIKPEFDPGLVIGKMFYLDLDDIGAGCWSLDPDKHGGYFKERTADGKPIFVAVH